MIKSQITDIHKVADAFELLAGSKYSNANRRMIQIDSAKKGGIDGLAGQLQGLRRTDWMQSVAYIAWRCVRGPSAPSAGAQLAENLIHDSGGQQNFPVGNWCRRV